MNNKYIFIDIDGTIYDAKSKRIPETTLDAINIAHNNGHHLFICTGRPLSNIPESILKLPVDGFILSCGAYIIINNEVVYKGSYDRGIIDTVSDYLLSHNIGFALEGPKMNYLYGEAFDFFEKSLSLKYDTREELMVYLKTIKLASIDDIKENDYDDILKITVLTTNKEDLYPIENILDDRVSSFIDVESCNFYKTEITKKGVNKATGIEYVINYLKANHEDTIAIGDSMNDIEMMNYAHISVCMGNGNDEIKALADIITDDFDHDGFYKAFKTLNII